MKVGVFDHLDNATLPIARFLDERLSLIEAYDRAGFYAYHLAEHQQPFKVNETFRMAPKNILHQHKT